MTTIVQLNSNINTVTNFMLRVAALNNISDAYNVFEYECTDELRATIYELSTNSSEPFRSAMHHLGFTNY